MGKDIPWKMYPKETWNGYTNIRQIDFMIKLLSETKEDILLWNLGRSKQMKTHYICMDWKT